MIQFLEYSQARGVWMLMYFSHQDVSMLDGGLSKWLNENLPVETKPNGFKPSDFTGTINPEIITGFENIRDNLNSLKILDARSPGEYDGSIVRAAQSGHIPNSLNIDWSQNLKEDGTFKTDEELSKMLIFQRCSSCDLLSRSISSSKFFFDSQKTWF